MPNTTTKQDLRPPRRFGPVGVSTGPEIPSVPDNYYRAIVKDVQEGTSNFDNKDQYVVEFELLDFKKPDGSELTLRAYISIPPTLLTTGNLNENSNLYAFLMALGYEPDNIEIEPTAWQGQELRISVKNKKIESGDNAGQMRPKIDGYSAPLDMQPVAVAPPPAAPRVIPPRRPVAATTPTSAEDGNNF